MAMHRVRFHPDQSTGTEPRRLNLLLSSPSWKQECQDKCWARHLPALLEPLGISSLRAGSGRQATQLIQQHKIHIAVVDLSVPFDDMTTPDAQAEAGDRILALLARLPEPPPTVVVRPIRTHRAGTRELSAALKAGAFAVIDSPSDNLGVETLLEVLRRCLARHYANRWPSAS